MNKTCEICGSNDTKIITETKKFGAVNIGNYEYLHCNKCEEEVIDKKVVEKHFKRHVIL